MESTKNYQSKVEKYFNKPSLILRIKSMMIDSFMIIILMYLTTVLLESFDVESGMIRGSSLILVLLYEPILVTINRTVGQKIMGIRVRKFSEFINSNEKVNINIFSSMVRFVGKLTLGFLSLLTIHSDKYGQAIHDKFGNSIMTIE